MGAPRTAVLDALARLLDYPEGAWKTEVGAAEVLLRQEAPSAASALGAFLAHVARTPATDLEEAFTRTFDWNSTRCLEVGWHLYGEQYERGAFLVRMRDGLRQAGLDEGTELPDHLASCLRLLGRMPDADAAAFSKEVLLPALARIAEGFAKDRGNPYAGLLDAVRATVETLRDDVGAPTGAPR